METFPSFGYNPPRKPIFVTFYSFKGGVGRTMALVNVASILAGRGRRVLMIDFDLEAPGLTFLAMKGLSPDLAKRPRGLVDLINDFIDDPTHSPLANQENKAAFHESYVLRLKIPDSLQRLEGGYLDLLPCGKLDENYEENLYRIDFAELYEEGVGLPLFQHIKALITDSSLYDYILIDSRTGFSDEGGICTRDLADYIVMVMGLNQQNVDGTVRFLRRLKLNDWQNDRLIFVTSPVPIGMEDLRDKRVIAARRAIEEVGFKSNFTLRIPYHPRLSLDEDPFDHSWTETDLYPAYERIQDKLRELANDTPRVLIQWALSEISRQQYDLALQSLQAASIDAPNEVASFLGSIIAAMEGDPVFRKLSDPFFQLWLNTVGDDVEGVIRIRLRLGLYLLKQGDYQGAAAQFDGALTAATLSHNEYGLAFARQCMGLLYQRKGRYQEALEAYGFAMQFYDSRKDRFNLAVILYAVADIYVDDKEYLLALDNFNQAVDIFSADDNLREAVASVTGNMGVVNVRIGNIEEGLKQVEQAQQTLEIVGTKESQAKGYVNFITALLDANRVQDASHYLNVHWDVILHSGEADVRYEAYVLQAKIKAVLGDSAGAVENARIAAKFYREQDVHTKLALEAEALAQLDGENKQPAK